MAAIPGWLLPVLLCGAFGGPILATWKPDREDSLCRWGIGGLLSLLTLGFVIDGGASWYGPSLFRLDSFHEIRLHLDLSLFGLALLWATWWFQIHSLLEEQRSQSRFAIPLLILLILSRDLWLSLAALIGFTLIQESLGTQRRDDSLRTRALRGCYGSGVLLLLLSMAILSFDFEFSNYAHLAEEVRIWDQFSPVQQADLRLAALLASVGVLLMAGVFPVSSLWIDREATTSTDLLGILAAVVFADRLLPLFTATQMTSLFLMLLLWTVASAMVVSLAISSRIKRQQGIALALLMLGFLALYTSEEGELFTTLRYLGIEQCLLSLVLWRRWQRPAFSNRFDSRLQTVLTGWLILDLSGWATAIQDAVNTFGPISPLIPALISAGLAYSTTRVFHEHRETISPKTGNSAAQFDWIVVVAIVLTIRLSLWKAGLNWFVLPSWDVVAGAAVGFSVAWALLKRPSESRRPGRLSQTFQQLAESQFHTLDLWGGLMQIPAACLGTLLNLIEVWQLRRQRGTGRWAEDDDSKISFRWELALGGASLLVLSGLFLWMKG